MRVLKKLWLRMTEIYGHKFISSYGVEPNESWIRCMANVLPDQIAAGMNALLSRDDPWPPTAIEFRNLCLNTTPAESTDWEHARIRAADERNRSLLELPPPPRDEALVASGIAKLKAAARA